MNLNEVAQVCHKISMKREENGGVGRDVLKHCAGEVCEAIEARDAWHQQEILENCLKNVPGANAKYIKECYADELADVIICALVASAESDIDITAAIRGKIKQNEARALGLGDKL